MKTLPSKGFVFWPVGTGDSTTIVINPNSLVVQVDVRQTTESEDKDSPATPVIDELVRLLPKITLAGGVKKPYLALFVLTHPDQDHMLGFGDLLKRVHIGEIWHTPRIFREFPSDLCDDAKTFRKEAHRRRDATIAVNGDPGSGNRVRVIGHDSIFQEDDYKKFPKEWRTIPGTPVTEVDGIECGQVFEAFIHGPFKDKDTQTRNNTSLAMQVRLTEGPGTGKGLFFGDRDYKKIKRIFDVTKEKGRGQYLEWNVMLTSHHCSKSVMYWKGPDEKEETFRKDIMDDIEASRLARHCIVASSHASFTDGDGDLPPHLKARKRYEEIVEQGWFVCTHEHPSKKQPEPIVFIVDQNGFRYERPAGKVEAATSVAAAVAAARGGDRPPREQVGFGILK